MLKVINDAKDTERELQAMRNRIDKLKKEKDLAETQIKLSKAKVTFINKVTEEKHNDKNAKEQHREKVMQQLESQATTNKQMRDDHKSQLYKVITSMLYRNNIVNLAGRLPD